MYMYTYLFCQYVQLRKSISSPVAGMPTRSNASTDMGKDMDTFIADENYNNLNASAF